VCFEIVNTVHKTNTAVWKVLVERRAQNGDWITVLDARQNVPLGEVTSFLLKFYEFFITIAISFWNFYDVHKGQHF
jgi:hypothetical protein